MKSFTGIAATITAIVSLASAAPTPAVAAVSQSFLIRSQVFEGNEDFNGQYLVPYHTGAGFNAATFTKFTDGALEAYINGTRVEFPFGQGETGALGFGSVEDLYAGWGSMTLNIDGIDNGGYLGDGFSVGPHGFLTHTMGGQEEFSGWRICNWVHGVPELFFDTLEGPASDIPTSCARVYLAAEYV